MNSTNRALNRLLLGVVGLVLLVVGGAAAAAALVPNWTAVWQDSSATASEAVRSFAASTQLDALGRSWLLPAAVLLAAVVIALLLWFVLRQGRGRTGTAYHVAGVRSTRRTAATGGLTVSTQLARTVLAAALESNDDIVSVRVSSYRVRRTPVLKVTLGARPGASVARIATALSAAVSRLDRVLGTELPVLAQITNTLPARLSSTSRVSSPTRVGASASTPTDAVRSVVTGRSPRMITEERSV